MNHRYGKILVSLLLLVGALLAATGIVDHKGEEYTDTTLTRALVAFGVARGLNGVISVAQGTEVAIEPAGIGINFAPGEILDPINDLVERFSWVMLVSSASIGVQKILLQISAWPAFTVLIIVILLLAVAMLWLPHYSTPGLTRWALRLALVFLVLRFCVPTIAIVSELVYTEFLAAEYEQASARLEQTTDSINRVNQAVEQEIPLEQEQSVWDKARGYFESATASMDVSHKIEQYKQAAADTSKHVINLIVIFVFQTILLPVGFLYLAYLLARRLWRVQFDDR